MTELFLQYLATYSNKNVPNNIQTFAKIGPEIFQKISKPFKNRANTCEIWLVTNVVTLKIENSLSLSNGH